MTRSVVLCIALVGCGFTELPPPRVPERLLTGPTAQLGEPPAGQTTVVLESSEPALVQDVTGATSSVATTGQATAVGFGISTNLVCTTPCTANLNRGQHQLVLTRASDGEWAGTGRLDLGVRPVAFRYNLGHVEPHWGPRLAGYALASLGAAGLTYGGIELATGDTGALPTTIGSAAITVVGALLMAIYRPEVQNGSGTQWELANVAGR
jgi:hypothetical protein